MGLCGPEGVGGGDAVVRQLPGRAVWPAAGEWGIGGVWLRHNGFGGLSVWAMANAATTKAARQAARQATIAAQQQIAARTRANMEDLTLFFSARQRADAVDDWLTGKVAALQQQAQQRRADQLRQCGAALAAMQQRGENVREIARLAGISEKAARELIRAPVADGAAVVAAEDRAGAVQPSRPTARPRLCSPSRPTARPRVRRVSRGDACGRVSAGGVGARGHNVSDAARNVARGGDAM